jgi:DNA-binding NarL/FixJ family response regulator
MIRVAIADDHLLLLEGLSQALAAIPDIQVVATARDGEELVQAATHHHPDVLLVDLDMPKLDGLAALGRIDNAPPALVVTMHTDDEHRRRAQQAGAVGFLSKATPLPDLAAAIRAARAGADLMDPESLRQALLTHREPVLDEGAAALTARERELLALLATGVSTTEELADRLFISQKTVKNHLASIYHKLAVADRAQAVVEAIRLGIAK